MTFNINATVLKTIATLSSVTLIILLSLSLSATELTPADKINPTKADPALNNHAQQPALKLEDNASLSTREIKAKAKLNLWNWLKNTSKKPAYFHYLDILELLG